MIRALLRLNIGMSKTQKELAFLRDLYIDEAWTKRFTDLADKHLSFSDKENFLYINAGTGSHALFLREKIKKNTEFFATCEDKELLIIARDKSAAVKADIDFSRVKFEDDIFEAVLADASFVRPRNLDEFVGEIARVTKSGGNVGFFLVTAGSFGEIFSLLWEVLFNEDLGEHGAAVEKLISEIPTVSHVEEIAESAGLKNIETHAGKEVFEYKNGVEFVNSPLAADFLLPVWLKFLKKKEKERVIKKLAQLIDAEDGTLTFRFCVKAALVSGEKK